MDINGGTLNIGGDYRIQSKKVSDELVSYGYSTGYLIMDNEEDRVNVDGDFVMSSTQNHTGKLTAGTLTIKGNFKQERYDSYNNFSATGTHKVVFTGEKEHTISLANSSGTSYSYFSGLCIDGETVTVNERAVVIGELSGDNCQLTGYIDLCGDAKVRGDFNGNLRIGSSYTMNSDIHITGNLAVDSYLYLSNSQLTVDGNVSINSRLDVQNGTLECGENMSVNYNGYIYMQDEAATLIVHGNYTHDENYRYYTSSLTNGTMYIGGDCSINTSKFAASSNHVVVFDGTEQQTVTFGNAAAKFNNVIFRNTSEDGVRISTQLNANSINIEDDCIVKFSDGGDVGFTLEDGITLESYNLSLGTLDLNGHTLTITGDFIQSGGTVDINGGILNIGGDYRIQSKKVSDESVSYGYSTGYLIMDNEEDRVNVDGDFVMSSSQNHTGKLTAGTLTIKGNFKQERYDSYNNFSATGTHKVIFAGEKEHTISFANSYGTSYSYFSGLCIDGETVTVNDRAVVIGELSGDNCQLIGYIDLCGDAKVRGDFNGNLRIGSGYTMNSDIHATGDLVVDSYLYLSNSQLTVDGNVTIGSRLYVQNGTLNCGGNLTVNYYYGLIYMQDTNGIIRVKGNYTHNGGYYSSYFSNGTMYIEGNCNINYSTFSANSNHTVVFDGTEQQTVTFGNAAAKFNNVIFRNTSEDGVLINSTLNAAAVSVQNNCKVKFKDGGHIGGTLEDDDVIEGDYCLEMGTLDLNGHTLTINGDFIHAGGTVSVNGGTLQINGNYRMQSLNENGDYSYSVGYLEMNNTNDTVNVEKSFYAMSTQDHRNYLTAGTLTVKGDFTQKTYSSGYNFSASGTHKTVLAGTEIQNISSDTSYSYLNHVTINNPKGISINSNVYVNGTIEDLSENVGGSGDVYITDLLQLNDGHFSGNIYLNNSDNQNARLTQDMTIGNLTCRYLYLNGFQLNVSSMYVYYKLDVGNGVLECKGNLSFDYSSRFYMTDEAGYVWVGGHFSTDSYYSTNGTLTAGTLEIKGDFTQTRNTAFVASGTHRTVLSGRNAVNGRTLIQTIRFYTPVNSKFNTLVITKPMTSYIFVNNSGTAVSAELVYNELIEEFVDTESPAKVTGLSVSDLRTTSVSLNWNASSDNVGVMGYEVYRNGKKIYTTSACSFTDSGLDPETTYIYEIYAFDECRNYSAASAAVAATTKPDTEAPSTPQDLNVKSRTGSSVTITWSPSQDNVKTEGYIIYCDDQEIGRISGNTTYHHNGLQAGQSYCYQVSAYDGAGNESVLSPGVSGAPVMPSIESVSPKDYSEIGGTSQQISVIFTNTGNSTGNKVQFEYKKSGEDDTAYQDILGYMAGQQYYFTNKLIAKCNWDLTGLNGNYDIRVTLYDAENNTCERTVTYTVDTSGSAAPENLTATAADGVAELKWTPSISANCSYYLLYRANEDSDQFDQIAKVNGSLTARYIDSDVEPLQTYQYQISAVSKYGIEGSRSAIAIVVVDEDHNPPRIDSITPDASRINGIADICVQATDNIAVQKIQLAYRKEGTEKWSFIGEQNAKNDKAVISWDTAHLADGSYQVQALAVDANGNVSEESIKKYTLDNSGPEQVQINSDECTTASSFVSIRWEDIVEPYFGCYAVEQLDADGSYTEVGRTSTTAGMHIEHLQPDTSYIFRVVAYDDLGNRGIASEPLTLTTTSDQIAPAVKSFYPASSAFGTEIPISIEAADNIAVQNLKLRYSRDTGDEKNWTDVVELTAPEAAVSARFSYSFDVSELAEGEIYIEAVTYDTAGNASAACVNCYKIDRTAPSPITDLIAAGNSGNIHLTWTVQDDDVSKFEIYRAEDGKTMYTKLCDCTTKDYYDISVKFGAIYTYKIVAVDIAGNRSEESNEAIAQAQPDTEAPKVLGFNPTDGSYLPENPKMSVVLADNNVLNAVTVSYQQADAEDGIWYEIGTFTLNSNYQAATMTWDTSDLEEGSYVIKAVAEDVAGNISEPYFAEYILKNTAPEAPVLELFQEDWAISLEWSVEDDSEIAYYRLYKKLETDADYTVVGNTDLLSYEDGEVIPNLTYSYKIEAYDIYGNVSESNPISGCAYDTDTVAPVIHVPAELTGLSGSEIMLDGTESTDNVRITNFEWDLGNGDTVYGARTAYIYEEPGEYTVTLTASDEAGNTAKQKIHVTVLDKTEYGNVQLTVVDENHVPIKYAYVYFYTAESESEKTLRTDYTGTVNISGKLGTHQVAVYKEGYLPVRTTVEINQYGDNGTQEVTMCSGELVTGNLTVHRMTLEEMLEAGVDFRDPGNYNTCVFTIELTFAQEPIPTVIQYVYTGGGGGSGTGFGSGFIGGCSAQLSDGSTVQVQPIIPETTDTEYDEVVPILAYIRTTESISFMKEMYAVDLGVMNHATSEFVIKDCAATLNLPKGLSLAATSNQNNTLTQSMGDIAGQESKTISWTVRGDKKGEYYLDADFYGTLMPFQAPVRASFKTESPFVVGVGRGLHLYIYPEELGYVGKDYYIQYKLSNEGSETFYNLTTTFGAYENPEIEQEITVIDLNGEETKYSSKVNGFSLASLSMTPAIPIVSGGQSLAIECFVPGDSIYGTYKTKFNGNAGDDPEKVRYRLIESMVSGLEDTDIQVHICPIPSHVIKYNVKYELVPSTWADPVDMTTGAFTDDVSLLSVTGGSSALSLDAQYSSAASNTAGELGYGWSHGYEAYLEVKNNIVDVHWDAAHYASFMDESAVIRKVNGQLVDNIVALDLIEDTGYKNYLPISQGMDQYKLHREDDNTYVLVEPGERKLYFDTEGKLSAIEQTNGQAVHLTRAEGSVTITDDITGAALTLIYNDDGKLTGARDGYGRTAAIAYENGNIKTFINALGESIHYVYDEEHRILSATASDETTPYVINEYDEENRVIKQYDGLGSSSEFSYTTDEYGILTTTGIDRNGNTISFQSDHMGHVIAITDQNGHTTGYSYDDNGNLLAEINANGNAVYYSYDDANNLLTVKDYNGNITSMTYDAYGNILTVDGSDGEQSTYTYNPNQMLATTAENSGVRRTYAYNANAQMLSESVTGLGVKSYTYTNGRLTAATDYMGNPTMMTYDETGNVIKTVDRDGNETLFQYDALGRTTAITTADGTVSYTYDARGNQTSVTDARGNTTSYSYDNNNQLISEMDASGAVTTYSYDGEGNITRIDFADGTFVENAYDPAGNLIKATDAEGGVTEYAYDALNRVTTKTVWNGEIATAESYTYYANGKPKTVTYADGSSISYTYDKAGRLVQSKDSQGNTANMTYDKSGNLLSSTDAEGNTVSYTYDIYGRVLSMTDANGNVTTYDSYDVNGNCLQITQPNGQTVHYEYSNEGLVTGVSMGELTASYTYDAAGRVKTQTDEEGNVTSVTYDENGNILTLTDAEGNVIAENQYDVQNQLILTKDALGIETQYEYDIAGNLKKTIANLNTARQTETSYQYDKIGRMTSVKDAEDGTAAYEYDQIGNITAMIDPNGGRTEYTYDNMGRITDVLNAIGSRNSYTYNAIGLLETTTNARGQETSYTYYKNGWIKSFTDELGTVSYTYDGNGNVLTVTDENGTITRTYDEMNRVTEYTDFRGNTISYSYDQIGNLVALTYPGGRIVRYTYDKTGRVLTVTDWNDNVTSYGYDKNGRLTTTTRPDGSVESRTYNAAGKLISQVDRVGDTVINARDYIYDESGNIINATMSNGTEYSGLTNAEMEYDDANRLVKYNGEAVEYDADGNMIYGPLNGTMAHFTYDCRNRLVSAGGVTYAYDAENQRIGKTANDIQTSFVIDSSGALSRILTQETAGVTTYYVYGTGLISQEQDGKELYYHYNNIGSTEAVTDSDGKIVETYQYGPYGELTSENKCGILFLYNGEYGVATDENGLYYMRARYYNSEIKRFINQDVVIGSITESPSMNRYAYVQGNPISLSDPFGLSPSINWSLAGHALLDLLGLIPGVGVVFDVANMIWYIAEGDAFGAICSFISALPCIGEVVGAFMAGTKLAKFSCSVVKITKMAAHVGSIGKSMYVVGNVVRNNVEKYIINGEDFDPKQFVVDLVTVGMEGFAIGVSIKGLKNTASQSWCFVAGTAVLTAEGHKAIEEIKPGDMVLAENPETGDVEYKEVLETYENETEELIHVHVNGEDIVTTPSHPFYVNKFGWTRAAQLRAGDVLVLSNGEYVVVEFIQHEILESPVKVYNFEVEDFHTYFVGENSVLVHNGCGDEINSASSIETDISRPGDADFIGPIPSGSWRLTSNGAGAHLIERANVRGRTSLAVYDKSTTPRFYPYGTPENAGQAHIRLHEATKGQGIKLRGGNPRMTDAELLENYVKAYNNSSLSGIRGDLRTPDASSVIAQNVTPAEAIQLLLEWGKNQGG